MKSRKGFTLIELMVVVLIVGILAAIAIPILRGRIDAAKWSEGKAIMGSIATAIRAYAAEKDPGSTDMPTILGIGPTGLGFAAGDLDGTYFNQTDFESTAFVVTTMYPLDFVITCRAASGGLGDATDFPTSPAAYELDETGTFTPIP